MPTWFVPERFAKAVAVHVLKNIDLPASSPGIALLLGIHGPAGHGKTFQLKAVLDGMGARIFNVSGAELESPDAAVPRDRIWDQYRAASAAVESGKAKLAAVVINDIDAGVGMWGPLTQYTVNRQIVFGCLMDLSDDPTRVGDTKCLRIPIVVTGNDFTALHGPVVRLGRMALFEWQLRIEEKFQIVHRNIFPELRERDCRYLVKCLERAHESTFGMTSPLSLYSSLRSGLGDDEMWDAVRGVLLEKLQPKYQPPDKSYLDVRKLVQRGTDLVSSHRVTRHLREARHG